jgi:acyl dehydratase
MNIGDAGPSRTDPPLTVQQFVRYQGASGDFNPIHFDTEFAQASGFPTPFAVGMLPASRLSSWLSAWVGVANITRFAAQFREQAWPGDELTYEGTVTSLDGDTAEVELSVTRQTGGVHIKGSATVLL